MLSGVIPILLSPFNEDGSLDRDGLDRLTNYYVSAGISGLVCFGEVSEPTKLSEEEKDYIIENTLRIAGDIPLIAGISREEVEPTVEAAKSFAEKGVSAFLLAPPRIPELPEDKIFEFYTEVDRNVDRPIIILDQPAGVRPVMSPELIVRIVGNTSNVRYLKIEDQPTPMKMDKIRTLGEKDLAIIGASHGRNFFWELERGASGILTSTPMPEILISIWKKYNSGDREMARELFYRSLPLAYYYADAPVSVKKEVLKHNGYISSARMRDGGLVLSDPAVRDLVELIDWTKRAMVEVQQSSS